MNEEQRKHLNELIESTRCTKDYKCRKNNFKSLCTAVENEVFLECKEAHPEECPFSVCYKYKYYCQCPVRIYLASIAKNESSSEL
ncbi:MAG TPA: hypothetical protein DD381_12845 [Lentisphaeria bacterium]|nr:MAG: hypothetical protein A2X47_12415 [Lentisphaerae bacterium GWF2_38_69]HBM17212.1 hypothetical protein [Lentisphaeria bacterium]